MDTPVRILGALQALGRRTALRELLALLRSSDYRAAVFVANLLPELQLAIAKDVHASVLLAVRRHLCAAVRRARH